MKFSKILILCLVMITLSMTTCRRKQANTTGNNTSNSTNKNATLEDTSKSLNKKLEKIAKLATAPPNITNNSITEAFRKQIIEAEKKALELRKIAAEKIKKLIQETIKPKQQVEKEALQTVKEVKEKVKAIESHTNSTKVMKELRKMAVKEIKQKRKHSFITKRGIGRKVSDLANKGLKIGGKKITDAMKNQARQEAQSFDQKKLAETCTKSFMEALPPPFCWKKGADVGKIPTGCPPGFFRHLALCFENCRDGYKFDGGALCIGGCPGGYTWFPLTCTRWWLPHTFSRGSYFPKSITNFEAPCEEGYYRMGALCYRDCAKIQLVNCGIGMCAADSDTCTQGIIGMVTDVVTGIGKAVGFVLSFGASSAASKAIGVMKSMAKGASKVVQKAVAATAKVLSRIAKSKSVKDIFKKKIKGLVTKALKQFVMGSKDQQNAENVCDQVSDGLIEKMQKPAKEAFSLESLDVIGVGDIINSCSGIKDSNGGVACAKSILTAVDQVDPTGIAGVAAAFMQPTCDV